jgi:hypothetical protein
MAKPGPRVDLHITEVLPDGCPHDSAATDALCPPPRLRTLCRYLWEFLVESIRNPASLKERWEHMKKVRRRVGLFASVSSGVRAWRAVADAMPVCCVVVSVRWRRTSSTTTRWAPSCCGPT